MSDREMFGVYVGKRVKIVGHYSCSDTWQHYASCRHWPRCCILDVQLEGTYACQHIWVHHAESLKRLEPKKGERIELTGLVTTYKKRLAQVNASGVSQVADYTLEYPEQIIFPDRQPEDVAGNLDVATPTPILATLEDIKTLCAELGGQDFVERVLTAYPAVKALSDRVGGNEVLLSILKLLK